MPLKRSNKLPLRNLPLLISKESLKLRLNSQRTMVTPSVLALVLSLWDSPSVAVMMTSTSRPTPAEEVVADVEEEEVVVALPEANREEPDRIEETREERWP